MGDAHSEVPYASGVADGDFAELVYVVFSEAVFLLRESLRNGFGECFVGFEWWSSAGSFVGPFCVVYVLELGELLVECFDGFWSWLGVEPLFERAMEALYFPLCLWMVRGPIFLLDVPVLKLLLETVFRGLSAFFLP